MKIAIVHDFLIKLGGAERVLAVFHELYPEAPIYTLLYDKEGTKHFFDKSDYTIIPSKLNLYPKQLRRRPKMLLSKYPQTIEEFDFSEYDAVVSFSSAFAHGVITTPRTTHICYCYSPTRYLWDWYHEYLTENNIGYDLKGMYVRRLLHQIRIWDKLSVDRVDHWLTQSEHVKKRINKYYRIDSTVINPPVDLETIKPSGQDPHDYFLVVSRIEPYKKIDLVIEAFNNNNRRLVIIGQGSDLDRLQKLAQGNSNISFLGWLPDEEVYKYMSNSYAFIFPGEEDFGLTPIESMAAGRPVIALGTGGVTESVADGKTGIFFDEYTVDALQEAINKLDESYFLFSPENCLERAKYFSKESFQNKMKAYIEDVCKHVKS